MQIFDCAIVGVDGEIVPCIDQPRGVEDRADVRLSVLGFETCQSIQLRQSRLPASLDALQLFLMNLFLRRAAEVWFDAVQESHTVIEHVESIDDRQAAPNESGIAPKDG